MQRRSTELANGEFDVLVVGGGVLGAAAAREAALRGLRTALIEREDFGGGASAECFKMVHGGIRYMQHGDLARLRASCAERSALLRIAPHLVQPLPIVVPTYGHGLRGKFLLGTGMHAYDWLTRGRNAGIHDPQRQIADSRFLTRAQTLQLFPQIDTPKLTGAAIFEDGQMYHPARLVLAFVQSAVSAGAVACNYVAAVEFIRRGDSIRGVRAYDAVEGVGFDIRAHRVLNAAGPWAERLLSASSHFKDKHRGVYSRDAYVVLNRAPAHQHGLAIPGSSRDGDALISRSARHLFLAPWRQFTLMGVWHKVFTDNPDRARVEREEIREWIDELNAACPALAVREDEVCYAHCGLVPFGEKGLANGSMSFGKRARLIDHRSTDGISGIVSAVGIRFTTARADAAQALDFLLRQYPQPTRPVASHALALAGGAIEDFARLRAEAHRTWQGKIPYRSLDALLRNHGRSYRSVLVTHPSRSAGHGIALPGTDTLAAEIAYAVREESAVRLDDVVLRRTDMGNGCHPGSVALEQAAAQMGELLRWSPQKRSEEIIHCERVLQRHLAARAATPDATNSSARSAS